MACGCRASNSIDPGSDVKESVQRFASFDRSMRIDSLVHFSEGVEQTPSISGLKLWEAWLSPLSQNMTNLAWNDRLAIYGPDDEIVGRRISDGFLSVGRDTLIEELKLIAKFSNGTSGKMVEISHGVPGMFPTQLDLPAEDKVVANEDSGSGNQARWIAFVVAVSKPDDPAVVGCVVVGKSNLKDPKVAGSVVTECMHGRVDLKLGTGELLTHLG